MAQNSIDRAIKSQEWLDRVAEPVQKLIGRTLKPGPTGTPLRNILHGTFLGHPLHPVLTDLPVGAWTVGIVLDLLSYLPSGRRFASAADVSVALGAVSALPTALSGLADWSHTSGHTRRVGTVHALANVIATGLYVVSLILRSNRNRGLGRGLAFLGYGVVSFSAYLGGELVYKHGQGTSPAAYEAPSEEWVDVGVESELSVGQMRKVDVGGAPTLIARDESGRISAISDTCTHMGCSLAEGRLQGTIVTCPCHGSQFDVLTGYAVQGPASVPEPKYEVSVLAGRIKVRPASEK